MLVETFNPFSLYFFTYERRPIFKRFNLYIVYAKKFIENPMVYLEDPITVDVQQ